MVFSFTFLFCYFLKLLLLDYGGTSAAHYGQGSYGGYHQGAPQDYSYARGSSYGGGQDYGYPPRSFGSGKEDLKNVFMIFVLTLIFTRSLSLLSFLLLFFFVIIGQQQMTGYPPPPHPPPHHPPPPPQEGTPAGFSQPRTSYASTADNFTGWSVYPSIPQYIWYASVMSVFASPCVRSSVYVSDL